MGRRRNRRGFSLLEALIAMTILLMGVVAIVRFFPMLFETSSKAVLQTRAAMFAQAKASEIMRDDDTSHTLATTIASLTTPTTPLALPDEPALSYCFCGKSLLYPESDVQYGTPNIARVIIRYSSTFRPSEDVIYELQFYKP
ncbi:MAG: prepilin-type N-terminal cleavage/methylation domain-containing protein [Candidatus Sumerlaeaceae bacterium]|nr:prepilin-type N-terminal cleavage/methylation domain-containing protein [Candidatus Sumerlaeaceae bacterium]